MKKIFKNKSTTYSTLRDSSIILNEDTSEYLLLNDIAKDIFELLDEGDSREVLKSKIRDIFDKRNCIIIFFIIKFHQLS